MFKDSFEWKIFNWDNYIHYSVFINFEDDLHLGELCQDPINNLCSLGGEAVISGPECGSLMQNSV